MDYSLPTLEECKKYSSIAITEDDFQFQETFLGIEYVFKEEIKTVNPPLRLAMLQWIDYLYKKEIGATEINDIDVTIKYGNTIPIEISSVIEKYTTSEIEVEAKTSEVFSL